MKVKDRITLELTLRCKFHYETSYKWQKQYHTIYIMEDAEGQQYKWDTTGILEAEPIESGSRIYYQIPQVGDKFILKGTVKDFSDYKGTPQVVLTRCKCIEITYKAPTKEEIEEQKKHEQLASLKEGDFVWRMPYRQYKEHYADCETLAGSYEAHENRLATISVIVRKGRLKASGVRGQHFSGYLLQNSKGHKMTLRAVSEENALKRAFKEYPTEDWKCVKIYY